jgi:cell division septation protein DedD
LAFLGALAVLLAGYWTGYNVAAGTAGGTALTIAEAAEIQPAAAPEAVQTAIVTPEPEKIEMDARDLGTQPQAGLHLQVSALKSPSAASKLQRRLESHGFPVRVDPASDDSLVRVYVGPIEGKAELQTLTSELKKEGLEPFPKRL